jgi:hypothetical protein
MDDGKYPLSHTGDKNASIANLQSSPTGYWNKDAFLYPPSTSSTCFAKSLVVIFFLAIAAGLRTI